MAPLFFPLNTVIFEFSPFQAILTCLFMATVYVASLYVWTKRDLGRDHPDTIKQRFVRVAMVCTIAIPFLWFCSSNSHSYRAHIIFSWIGMRFQGFFLALIMPLLLTMVLFLGPLSLHYMDGIFRIYKDRHYWTANFRNVMWLRNHVVAPLSEEFVFRACMLPLLVPCFGEVTAIFICPLFFGVAHFHHLKEKVKDGVPFSAAFLQCLFQFSYTTVFGAYSAFLFLRTGHLVAPVAVHAFCNHMGFPNFQEVLAYKYPARLWLMLSFVVGLLAWVWLLRPLTTPALYTNTLYMI